MLARFRERASRKSLYVCTSVKNFQRLTHTENLCVSITAHACARCEFATSELAGQTLWGGIISASGISASLCLDSTSDMLSLGWRCRFRRASTSARRRRGSHHAGCSIRHRNRTGGHRRRTHIVTPPLSHITLVRLSVRPFRVGVLCSWATS